MVTTARGITRAEEEEKRRGKRVSARVPSPPVVQGPGVGATTPVRLPPGVTKEQVQNVIIRARAGNLAPAAAPPSLTPTARPLTAAEAMEARKQEARGPIGPLVSGVVGGFFDEEAISPAAPTATEIQNRLIIARAGGRQPTGEAPVPPTPEEPLEVPPFMEELREARQRGAVPKRGEGPAPKGGPPPVKTVTVGGYTWKPVTSREEAQAVLGAPPPTMPEGIPPAEPGSVETLEVINSTTGEMAIKTNAVWWDTENGVPAKAADVRRWIDYKAAMDAYNANRSDAGEFLRAIGFEPKTPEPTVDLTDFVGSLTTLSTDAQTRLQGIEDSLKTAGVTMEQALSIGDYIGAADAREQERLLLAEQAKLSQVALRLQLASMIAQNPAAMFFLEGIGGFGGLLEGTGIDVGELKGAMLKEIPPEMLEKEPNLADFSALSARARQIVLAHWAAKTGEMPEAILERWRSEGPSTLRQPGREVL